MKLYIDLREDEAGAQPRCQLAISLPAKWLQFPVSKLLETYVAHYNKKFAAESHILAASDWAVTVKDPSPFARAPWKVLDASALMCDSFSDRHEVWLARLASGDGPSKPAGGRTCKRYGCQKDFTDATNGDDACCHHTGAPIFHDTRKWWSCCEQHKAYDFDGLFAIQGCARGRHSEALPEPEVKANALLREQSAKVAERAQPIRRPELPAHDARPVSGPASSSPAPPPALEPPKPKLNLPPGMARCKHFGCQKDYEIDANGPDACRYHVEAPVFHDGTKKWPCCKKKAFEFDDFIAIPGCASGPHECVV